MRNRGSRDGRPAGIATALATVVLAGVIGTIAPDGKAAAARTESSGTVSMGTDTIRMTDDRGRTLVFSEPPRRIVSLIPTITELLFALDRGDRLVGRTRYGIHPPQAREVESVGEGVRTSVEEVVSREPDLVIPFAGPDNRATLAEFERLGIPTLAIRHDGFEDLHRNIERLGLLTGAGEKARRLSERLRCRIEQVAEVARKGDPRTIYYEVWDDPPITVGQGSYLDSLIAVAGGRNVFGDLTTPSARVSLEAIVERQPELILVAETSEDGQESRRAPARRPGWDVLAAVRRGDVRTVDGDLVHRLGPRLGAGAAALAAAIHPELAPELERAASDPSRCS